MLDGDSGRGGGRVLLDDEAAVSPVVAIVLLVAITVVLASTVGTFGLSLGESANEEVPSANFDTAYDDGAGELTVTHVHGAVLDAGRLSWAVQGGDESIDHSPEFTGTVGAGDAATVTDVGADETVLLVWRTAGGDRSAIVMRWDGPAA